MVHIGGGEVVRQFSLRKACIIGLPITSSPCVCVFASNTEEPTNKKLTNSQMLEYNNANLDQYRAVV